ncbi:hypothetical protein DFP72DRAFT_1041920 [Ephemerocybe angulata]|uniref:Uncharacterized protein n=1 Tax=Ephemerocybe angulata TaxID=980116 RepID=A0A8H6MA96_9AGAR|nr:hypothetical protein DFP72DRAFT_1041920 [Tulosesus angulatus]
MTVQAAASYYTVICTDGGSPPPDPTGQRPTPAGRLILAHPNPARERRDAAGYGGTRTERPHMGPSEPLEACCILTFCSDGRVDSAALQEAQKFTCNVTLGTPMGIVHFSAPGFIDLISRRLSWPEAALCRGRSRWQREEGGLRGEHSHHDDAYAYGKVRPWKHHSARDDPLELACFGRARWAVACVHGPRCSFARCYSPPRNLDGSGIIRNNRAHDPVEPIVHHTLHLNSLLVDANHADILQTPDGERDPTRQ